MRKDDVPYCKPEFWAYLVISLVCILFAGVTSGLALGLLSSSELNLEVQIKAGQPQDRKHAAKILPIVKNEHLLLCTLLISKSLALEALPIFLDSILPPWGAILISAILVVALVEIFPQAVCSRYGLSLGAKLATFVRLLLWLFFPMSYPFSKLLDWLLGKEHPVLFRRAELKTFVGLHANEAGKGGELSHHETSIITGALDLTEKTAKNAMTPISEIFSLDINSKLDPHTMGSIISRGYNRIPVYAGSPKNIIGLVLFKNLIFCRPEDETPIKHVMVRGIPRVHEDWPLYDMLNQFLKGHIRMAVVVKSKNETDTADSAIGKPNMMGKNSFSNSKLLQAEGRGFRSPFHLKHINISTEASPGYSTDSEYQSPALKNALEKEDYLVINAKNCNRGDGNLSPEELEFPQRNTDEEVVGLITLEDVMEELLQEEISDEIDEYVDVRNQIRINLLSSRRSSPRSPRQYSGSHLHWRTPEPSPLASYSHILRSPISPYVQPPLIRPILYASPGKPISNRD